jgi:hypothetical protein
VEKRAFWLSFVLSFGFGSRVFVPLHCLCSVASAITHNRGRLVLINSVLSGLPMFMMSFFRIPKGVKGSMQVAYRGGE